MDNPKGDSHSFIVRIWHEPRAANEEQQIWRGVVDHVGGDQRLYFQELQRLLSFIQARTGMSLEQPSGWRSKLERIKNGIRALTHHPDC